MTIEGSANKKLTPEETRDFIFNPPEQLSPGRPDSFYGEVERQGFEVRSLDEEKNDD